MRRNTALLVAALALVLAAGSVNGSPAAEPADLPALESALANDPENPERYVALGDALLAAGQGERAGRVYRRLIDLRPHDCRGHAGLARSFLAQGIADHAMRSAEDARKECPMDPEVQLVLGRAYLAAKEDILAIESLQRSIELNPNHLETYGTLADAFYVRRLYPEAAAVDEASLVRPGLSDAPALVNAAHARLARIYSWAGEFDRAARHFELAFTAGSLGAPTLQAISDDLAKDSACRASMRLAVAQACESSGDLDRARPEYDRVLGCGNAEEKERARIALERISSGDRSTGR